MIDVTAGNCTITMGRLCEGSLSMIVSPLWLHGFRMCRATGKGMVNRQGPDIEEGLELDRPLQHAHLEKKMLLVLASS